MVLHGSLKLIWVWKSQCQCHYLQNVMEIILLRGRENTNLGPSTPVAPRLEAPTQLQWNKVLPKTNQCL